MEVEIVGIVERVEIALGDQGLAQLLPRPEFNLDAELAFQIVAGMARLVGIVGPPGADHAGGDGRAGDLVLGDAAADQIDGLDGQVEQLARLLDADLLDDGVRPGGIAAADEAAIAARRAPGDALGFHHHGGAAALQQAERRVQPGEPAADDADIGLDVA